MACHGQCVSSAAFQQPANVNVVLVKKTEMVRHGQATGKPCVSSAAFQQPANFNVVLVKKTEMVSLQH